MSDFQKHNMTEHQLELYYKKKARKYKKKIRQMELATMSDMSGGGIEYYQEGGSKDKPSQYFKADAEEYLKSNNLNRYLSTYVYPSYNILKEEAGKTNLQLAKALYMDSAMRRTTSTDFKPYFSSMNLEHDTTGADQTKQTKQSGPHRTAIPGSETYTFGEGSYTLGQADDGSVTFQADDIKKKLKEEFLYQKGRFYHLPIFPGKGEHNYESLATQPERKGDEVVYVSGLAYQAFIILLLSLEDVYRESTIVASFANLQNYHIDNFNKFRAAVIQEERIISMIKILSKKPMTDKLVDGFNYQHLMNHKSDLHRYNMLNDLQTIKVRKTEAGGLLPSQHKEMSTPYVVLTYFLIKYFIGPYDLCNKNNDDGKRYSTLKEFNDWKFIAKKPISLVKSAVAAPGSFRVDTQSYRAFLNLFKPVLGKNMIGTRLPIPSTDNGQKGIGNYTTTNEIATPWQYDYEFRYQTTPPSPFPNQPNSFFLTLRKYQGMSTNWFGLLLDRKQDDYIASVGRKIDSIHTYIQQVLNGPTNTFQRYLQSHFEDVVGSTGEVKTALLALLGSVENPVRKSFEDKLKKINTENAVFNKILTEKYNNVAKNRNGAQPSTDKRMNPAVYGEQLDGVRVLEDDKIKASTLMLPINILDEDVLDLTSYPFGGAGSYFYKKTEIAKSKENFSLCTTPIVYNMKNYPSLYYSEAQNNMSSADQPKLKEYLKLTNLASRLTEGGWDQNFRSLPRPYKLTRLQQMSINPYIKNLNDISRSELKRRIEDKVQDAFSATLPEQLNDGVKSNLSELLEDRTIGYRNTVSNNPLLIYTGPGEVIDVTGTPVASSENPYKTFVDRRFGDQTHGAVGGSRIKIESKETPAKMSLIVEQNGSSNTMYYPDDILNSSIKSMEELLEYSKLTNNALSEKMTSIVSTTDTTSGATVPVVYAYDDLSGSDQGSIMKEFLEQMRDDTLQELFTSSIGVYLFKNDRLTRKSDCTLEYKIKNLEDMGIGQRDTDTYQLRKYEYQERGDPPKPPRDIWMFGIWNNQTKEFTRLKGTLDPTEGSFYVGFGNKKPNDSMSTEHIVTNIVKHLISNNQKKYRMFRKAMRDIVGDAQNKLAEADACAFREGDC